MDATGNLHLPDLHISGFRGIDNLDIPRLGRVTLLVGKNGVGKTTVLDAVRVYAERGHVSSLADVLLRHDETDLLDGVQTPNWKALFTGEMEGGAIRLGPQSKSLTIEQTNLNEEQDNQIRLRFGAMRPGRAALGIELEGHAQVVPLHSITEITTGTSLLLGELTWREGPAEHAPARFTPLSLGPNPLTNAQIADLWDHAIAEGREESALNALRIIFPDVQDVLMTGDLRTPRVKVPAMAGRPPLKRLGEGAVRLFGFGLAIAKTKDDFLLIDEAENGLHHSIQPAFWGMMSEAAKANNVQVIATTHSFDCVRGFAEAAADDEDSNGVVIRLTRSNGTLKAVEYCGKNLKVAAEQDLEVR